MKGIDIIDDVISTEGAFNFFRELEEADVAPTFKPPQLAESGGINSTTESRFNQDIPSVRIDRMKRELEEL